MATIRSAIELQDNFSRVLYGVMNAVNLTISSMEEMSYAMNTDVRIDTSSLQTAREEITRATSGLREMTAGVQEVEEPVQRVHSGFSGWQKAIMVANQAVGLIHNTIGRLGITDMSGAFDRLDTMNRFQKTITAMTGDSGMANAALAEMKENVLGTAYGLDVAAKSVQGFSTRGMSLGTAVDQVRIWSDAVSFYGKGTNEQLEGAVDAVGKILSKGTVEANQLDRLFDAGIPAVEMYAEAVGKSVADVKSALSNREISSAEFIQTVSEALDNGVSHGAAKSAGDTWATTFANMRAAISRGWEDVIQSVDGALASHGLPSSMEMVSAFGAKVESVLGTVGGSMNVVVGIAANIGRLIGGAGNFIVDNWSIISPVIYGVGIALLIYAGYLGVVKAAEIAAAAAKGAASLAAYIHVAAMNAETRAAGRATLAQHGLNSALLACPLTWMVVGFIAVVAVLSMVIAVYNKLNGTHISVMGAICGTINIAIQFFKNLGLAVANVALGIWNALGAVATNIKVAFHNAIISVQVFWYDLLSTVCKVIVGICEQLNRLPFIEFDYSGIQNKAEEYAAKQNLLTKDKEEYESIGDAFNRGINTYEIQDVFSSDFVLDSYNQGYQFGEGLQSKISDKLDFTKMFKGVKQGENEMERIKQGLDKTALTSSLGNTEKNTDKIAKKLDVTSEDIKYIRDFATQRAVNRYTSTTVKVDMTNHNSINGDKDVDGIVNTLKSRIQEEMNHSAEGVH